jgi:voltage-gated potassium channel
VTSPVSAAGREVAVVLMFVGVGIFGLLAASLASFFIERSLKQDDREGGETDAQLADIASRLERIERLLATPESRIRGDPSSEDSSGRA